MPWWQCAGSFWFRLLHTFQSFFYWNCLGGIHSWHSIVPINGVSILLLLELPWWPPSRTFPPCIIISFNPSFTGIALVAWLGKGGCDLPNLFQSFFYWNCLGGQGPCRGIFFFNHVSILLLLELPWWHRVKTFCLSNDTQFQSFFYWNCLGGIDFETPCFVIFRRFNPSFTGIALVALKRKNLLPCKSLVSILLLLELPWWLHFLASRISKVFLFQSFFYWNCLGGLRIRKNDVLIYGGFNPSFTGIALVACL